MPRQKLLTDAELDNLLALPTEEAEWIRLTTFSDQDISLINQHRGEANRLGFAIQLCYLRYPGIVLEEDVKPAPLLLNKVAKILKISEDQWLRYAIRSQTRWEHFQELYTYLGVIPYSAESAQKAIAYLTELATQTDKVCQRKTKMSPFFPKLKCHLSKDIFFLKFMTTSFLG